MRCRHACELRFGVTARSVEPALSTYHGREHRNQAGGYRGRFGEGVHPGLSTAIDFAGDHALVIGDQLLGTGSLLAIAIAMALSSVPITATIVILLSPQRRTSSLPFLAGWVLTLGVVPLAAAAGILAMPLSRRERSQFAAAAMIVVGAALVIGAILTWRRSQTRTSTLGGRLERLGSYGPGALFGIAILMGLRPKALLLGIAAGLALGAESPTSDRSALALALYVALSASTVAVPIVCTLVSPHSMEPRLVTWRERLSRSGLKVTASVMMMIGLVLVAVEWSQV